MDGYGWYGVDEKVAAYTICLCQIDHDSDVQQEVVKKRFADCLVRECENATTTHSHDAQWKRQLLLPHLEKFHKVSSVN